MIQKILGKISSVQFGYVGYQDMQFGLQLSFSLADGGGVGASIAEGWSLDMECSKHCKWTEEDRDLSFAKTMRRVNQVMQDAKVNEVYKLKGIPVEVTLDSNTLKDWRILKEVL